MLDLVAQSGDIGAEGAAAEIIRRRCRRPRRLVEDRLLQPGKHGKAGHLTGKRQPDRGRNILRDLGMEIALTGHFETNAV